MKTRKLFVLKTILIIFLFVNNEGFSQDTYQTHKTDNYSIEFPNNWTLDTSGKMNSEFLLFSELLENDSFSENVNLLIQDLKGQKITLETFVELSENQIKTLVSNSKIYDRETITINDIIYHQIIWSGFIAEKDLKFIQHFYVIDEKAYILTYTATIQTFEDYLELGTSILNSFKIN